MTSDAGLLVPRELDERLGLSAPIERHLTDPRTGRNFQFALPDLFRQSIYSRLAGYEDTNDAERWHVAYAIRLPANAVLERAIEDLLVRPRGWPSHAPLVRYRSVQ